MSEKTAQQPVAPPPEGEAQAAPAELTPAEVFQERLSALTAAMPEQAELITVLHESARSTSDWLKRETEHVVDRAETIFRIPLATPEGRAYNTSAPADEVQEVTDKFAHRYGKPKDGSDYREIERHTKDAIIGDRKKKIGEASEKTRALKPRVTPAKKAGYVNEKQDEFWREAQSVLDVLDVVAAKQVASIRERAVILGGFAINRPLGPYHKYLSQKGKQESFSLTSNGLGGKFSQAAESVRNSAHADVAKKLPQLDPLSPAWQKKLHKITADLDSSLAAKDYMTELEKAISKLMGKQQGRGNQQPAASGLPNYPANVTGKVDAEIAALRGQGLSDKEIRRKLAAKYHPDVNGSGDSAETTQRAGYVNEWYEGVIREEQEK